MKAFITVIGCDKVGIIAAVANILAEANVNIMDISQTTMQDMFTMIMMVDVSKSKMEFGKLADLLKDKGEKIGVSIMIQHEDIFNSMHRI